MINGILEKKIEMIIESISNCESMLLYGNSEITFQILSNIYGILSRKEEYLCHLFDASKIDNPIDFFEPILKLKYGFEYDSLKERSFKNLIQHDNETNIFELTGLCGRDESSELLNYRKMPLIFIHGIEELFFKMDFNHLSKEERRKFSLGVFWNQPQSKGFGDSLRSQLHQKYRAVFCGTIKDSHSLEYNATLGNFRYLFFNQNFRPYDL